jgi:hypothetical protein
MVVFNMEENEDEMTKTLLYTADEGAVSINVIIETGQQLFFHAIN